MSVPNEIIAGVHDDDLADITQAVARRERVLSPSDAIQTLAVVYSNIERFVSEPAQTRAQAGSELNYKLKMLADDPNPHVVALVNAARIEVLVKLLGVPRSTAAQINTQPDDDLDDAPDCSQCGGSNAGSREAPHLCETCQKLPQATP